MQSMYELTQVSDTVSLHLQSTTKYPAPPNKKQSATAPGHTSVTLLVVVGGSGSITGASM